MGDVIQFKKRERPAKPVAPRSQPTDLRIATYLSELLEDVATKVVDLDPEIIVYRVEAGLAALAGPPSSDFSRGVAQTAVSGFKLSELLEIAQLSTRTDWARSPAYYHALIARIKSLKTTAP